MSITTLVDIGHADGMNTSEICATLSLCRSSYYRALTQNKTQRNKRRQRLCRAILSVFEEHEGRYGAPRIRKALQKQGFHVAQKTVAKLMHAQSLCARPKRRFRPQTTDSKHGGPFAPNLLKQEFNSSEKNRVWAGDISYVWTSKGWRYLAVVIDLFSRKVVGWAIGNSPDGALAAEALRRAIALRNPPSGLIVHTDRGGSYVDWNYRKLLKKAGALRSMSGQGNCYDNACVESFFSTLEFELRSRCDFRDLEHARAEIRDYIDGYYNPKRMHSTLGYHSPVEYEQIADDATEGVDATDLTM